MILSCIASHFKDVNLKSDPFTEGSVFSNTMEEKRDRPDMNQMKDLMTCPVCALLFREPKILPCLHSFCMPCLESLVSFDAQHRSSLICPQCRRRVQIPGEGVSSLQTNLFAQNMLTVIALDNSSVNQISCENCISKEPPVSRCTLCRKFLCNFCTTAHRRSRDTVDHQLSSLEDVRSCLPGELAKPLFCSVHKKEKLVLYCESCQCSVCRDCTMMEHRSHKYAFAKEIYNKERSKIAEQLSEARSTGLFLKQGLAAVSKMRTNVDERTRAMIKELNDIFTQCMRTINDRYSFLYNQVQNIRNERLLHLDAQKSELEYAFGSIQSSIGFTELTLRNSTQVEVLAMKKYIMDRMKELTGAQYNCIPVADDNIRLTVDNTIMQLLSQLGRVEDTNTSPSASVVKGIDAPIFARQMASFLVQCYDGRGNPRNKGGDRIVVTVQSADDSSLHIKSEKCFQAQVVDRQNGCYSVTYTPINSGEHLITVFINGMVLKGSPFSVHVQENAAVIIPPITAESSAISQSDEDPSTLADPLLQFVNSSQAFEVDDSSNNELKRQIDEPEEVTSPKKFKLEPNDFDSLPDQLFAHSPDAIRIKQENIDTPIISSTCSLDVETNVSKLVEETSPQSTIIPDSKPEVKEQQEDSFPAPLSANFLTEHLENISSTHDFKGKFADESEMLNEHIAGSNSNSYIKLHSPDFPVDQFSGTNNGPNLHDNHMPSESLAHHMACKMNTPEHEFNHENELHFVSTTKNDEVEKNLSSDNKTEFCVSQAHDDDIPFKTESSNVTDNEGVVEVAMAPVAGSDKMETKNTTTEVTDDNEHEFDAVENDELKQ